MTETPRPLEHLIRALDELARAGLDAAELLSGRSAASSGGLAHQGILDALRQERARWSSRAQDDPAAAKVHEFFDLLLGVLGDAEGHAQGEAQGQSPRPSGDAGPTTARRAPRRSGKPRGPNKEVSR